MTDENKKPFVPPYPGRVVGPLPTEIPEEKPEKKEENPQQDKNPPYPKRDENGYIIRGPENG